MDALDIEAGGNIPGAGRYVFRFQPNGTGAPTGIQGRFIQSITYAASDMWLVTLSSPVASILAFNASVQGNSGGPAQGFTFEVDTANTALAGAASAGPVNGQAGAVIAIASVNASGTRATIAADANTWILCELVVSFNGTLVP